ncbi:MAG: type II toxin-antitoxin system HicA family toxin [Candidatus Hydrogenedentales bacterium]
MSPKLPHLTSREVVKVLEREGFVLGHECGSHASFVHPDGRRTVVPMHKGAQSASAF